MLIQPASAYLFTFSDEIDRANNINYALAHPYDGIDLDQVADYDDYNCFSLADQRDYSRRNRFDDRDELNANDISLNDFKRLRYDDQKSIIDENKFDKWDDGLLERNSKQQCWKLKDYNKLAKKYPGDRFDEVKFRDFDDLRTVQRIGTQRFHFFEPDDFNQFDLHRTVVRRPFYEPYAVRHTPYPRYGYGIRYGDSRYY